MSNEEIELSARFQRYLPAATDRLVRIASALARIDASDIRTAAADQLRVSAKVGTVHYSTLIEGNQLPLVEAKRAARGELKPDERAKIELINYVDALDLLDDELETGALILTPEFLLKLHATLMKGLGVEGSERFAPEHEGIWRPGHAVVADQFGNVFHEVPPPTQVEPRIRGLCSWISQVERRPKDYPAPVIAGVTHYAITDIHPFADGNGRVARLAAVALLMYHGLLPGRRFSFERYYAEDQQAYYNALRSVRRNTLNMEEWLEYFLAGLAEEYERVATKVGELEALGLRQGGPIQLTPTQERALTELSLQSYKDFRRADYERIAEVSKAQANIDLNNLRRAKLLVRRGQGPAARYLFRKDAGEDTRGRKRTWTDERIEGELREFCEGRTKWPTVAEFKQAGRDPLYQALNRHGGARHWAERLRLPKA